MVAAISLYGYIEMIWSLIIASTLPIGIEKRMWNGRNVKIYMQMINFWLVRASDWLFSFSSCNTITMKLMWDFNLSETSSRYVFFFSAD